MFLFFLETVLKTNEFFFKHYKAETETSGKIICPCASKCGLFFFFKRLLTNVKKSFVLDKYDTKFYKILNTFNSC